MGTVHFAVRNLAGQVWKLLERDIVQMFGDNVIVNVLFYSG